MDFAPLFSLQSVHKIQDGLGGNAFSMGNRLVGGTGIAGSSQEKQQVKYLFSHLIKGFFELFSHKYNYYIFCIPMEGMVSDIQVFSLHDGPGIRTTVFLKGCPLRCRWCSNPETFHPLPVLSHNSERCTSCFSCTLVCASGALVANGDHLLVNHEACKVCGDCLEECPEDALRIYGSKMSAALVVEKVEKDRVYFDQSGGGLTLSGGEALQQAAFSAEICRLARDEGIHTCLETSGQAPREDLEMVLPLVDLFLFDYKATEHKLHRELCGVGNETILENLHFLSDRGASIHLRCPMVKGLNDNEEHLQAIALLSRELKGIKAVELMPYHAYGVHKYAQLGMAYSLRGQEIADDSTVREWHRILESHGCLRIILPAL
jgi:pyruvate formate lyase activating enzyme